MRPDNRQRDTATARGPMTIKANSSLEGHDHEAALLLAHAHSQRKLVAFDRHLDRLLAEIL